ncbi:MAG: hypothetical protein HOD97_08505 [Candidatus Marinimicrobia bacterium]|jgi:hypothetical protein|nr:hypothetical protein [Candidatus Neomarinimicrobiota bacterium]MBT3618237.1 hypothetical protein [Candidatus Neomarinimicrobiota bacterium]MBT3829563.1 hypothetical protein [Candidatus Neomarinimicrobiota bacterium]MBT3997446.1 hypothetical protein [Candidatus Neomarinimicrobiota bacterium]MBT4281636.1 hypothetical protein [Candidatus Neomarinimicrobiota bacterium]
MTKIIGITIISFVLIQSLNGQVCCSLVGAIDHGGGTSSTQWDTQWPSLFDNRQVFKWVTGLNATHTDDDGLKVRYGTALNIYVQLSHYIGQKNVGYIQAEGSWILLEESLSFAKTSSRVQQLGLRLGIRHLLPGKWGYVFGEITLPKMPDFSNQDFAFASGAVPIALGGWTNRFQTPWFYVYPTLFPDVSVSVSFSKNQKKQIDVFTDDALSAHGSTSILLSQFLLLSPFSTFLYQKLLAPLSPWETERQSRWLSALNAGLDITPNHHKWNWLHLRFSWPVYRWSSSRNFPDGTEPVPRISISINRSGNL